MDSSSKSAIALAIAIIALGTGWLLTGLGIGPNLNWVWIVGLGLLGLLTFVASSGVDKASIVIGPFFLLASGLSILRQSGKLTAEIEVPVLVIVIGVLILFAQSRAVPIPKWYVPMDRSERDS